MDRSRYLRITFGTLLLFLVATAVCEIEDYNVLPEFAKGKQDLYNFLGHVTLQELIRSTVREVLTEIKEDQKESMDSLDQCAWKDQLEAIRHLISTERDCPFSGVDSNSTETLPPFGVSIPPPQMLEDAAFGKRSYSSSVHPPTHTFQANDGNDVTMFHSLRDIHPWWMVDLGAERTIYKVIILTRQDCCHERLHDVEIRIGNTLKTDGDFSTHTLITFYKGPYSLDQGILEYAFCHGITGRYLSLRIRSNEREYLQIKTFKAIALKS